MLSGSTDIMIRLGRKGELSRYCAESKLHCWQPCLA